MITVRRISGALGAEVEGVDLSKPLSAGLVADLRQAWLENLVLFFRDQPLTPAQYMAFAQSFGTPADYPLLKGIDGFPKIIEVKKLEHERVNFGGLWHSDTTYLDAPPMASMLLARETPPHGGDTLFANMYLAWDALSEGMRRMLRGLKAVNCSTNADASKTREDRVREDGKPAPEFTAEHPVARTHPETGRTALYVNAGHTVRFAGDDRGGGSAASRLPVPAPGTPGIHLSFRLAAGIDRVMGQSVTQTEFLSVPLPARPTR